MDPYGFSCIAEGQAEETLSSGPIPCWGFPEAFRIGPSEALCISMFLPAPFVSSVFKDFYGFLWFPIGLLWIPMGFLRFPMDSYRVPMDSYGFLCIPMESYGFLAHSDGFLIFLWIPMYSSGFQWIPIGFPCIPMYSYGFLWIPMYSCGSL